MAGKSYIKTNTYNWSKIRKMYVKTGATTWTAIRKAYLKTGTFAWRKVFDTSSNRPFIVGNDIPKIRINSPRTDSPLSGAVNPFIEAPPVQYVGPRSNNVKGATETPPYEGYPADGFGDYLWGYDGTWSPSSGVTFTRSWYWNNTGNNNDNQGDINPSSDDRDDKLKNAKSYLEFPMSYSILGTYLYFKVRGSNSSGPTDAVSAPVRLIRQEPEGTLSISTPASVPLNQPKTVTLTALNRWYDAPDQDESTLNWYSELSVSSPLLNSSTLVKSSRLIDIVPVSLEDGDGTAINETDSYIPVNVNSKGYSDADRYLFAVLTLKNSGTYYTGQTVSYTVNTTVPVGQTRSYTPQWNEYIKVSTNGYIGLGNASNISAVNDTSTIGHVVSFLNKDLKQIHLKYYSDSTKYIVDYAGKLYDVTSDTITYRYQAHFYPGQNYVDFYVINNAGGTSANAYLYDGDQQVAWGASKPAGDAYRIYLTSGVPFGTIAYNPRSTTTGFTNVTTNNQVDDGETSLQLLQGISAPENLQRPIFQLIFGTANKVGSTYRLPSGSWTNSPTEYNYYLVKNDINGTEVANSGWTTATYFDYTFTAATSQSVAGYVYARNSGGESFPAISTESIGPFTVLEATAPTSVTAANNGSTDTITVSWSGSTNATRYRIYWNSNGIVPGSADAYYDEEKIVNNTTITSSSGFWAWGPADPDRNSNLPAGRIAQYFMVSASSDGVTWTPYVVTSTATGVVLPVPVNTAVPTLTPTGAYSAGDTLTFGVGSWSNTPTSYSLRLYRGTQFVATSETLVKDAGNVTSSTYTIPASDYDGTGRYYYRAFATATNSGGTSNSGVYTAGAEGGPLAQPLSSPTPTSVSYSNSVFTVNFTGGSGPAYQVWYQAGNAVLFGTDAGTGDAQGTSSPITKTLGGTEGTTYYWWVRSAKTTTSSGTGNVSAWSGPVSVTIPITPRVPTITMQANTGVTTTAGTINWTSTNQASFSSNGTFSGTGTTGTSISKTGLTASTAYTGTVTVTSSTGHTAQANYSLTTSAPAATYTITYNGNGNTGGSTASQTGNGTITLRSNGFTRTNCTFQGWATSSAGAVSYPAGFSYNLTANVTLYAVWAAAANSANAPVVTFLGNSPGANTKRWSWTGGAVTGGTATGWQYAISSTSGTSGFGAFTATTTASLSLTVTNAASNPRWLKVRRTYTDGLGVAKVGPTNDPGV